MRLSLLEECRKFAPIAGARRSRILAGSPGPTRMKELKKGLVNAPPLGVSTPDVSPRKGGPLSRRKVTPRIAETTFGGDSRVSAS